MAHLGEPERIVSLSSSDFATFTPTLGTSPIFRSQYDFELSATLFNSLPRLGEHSDGHWMLEAKQGLFNMTSNSALFRDRNELLDCSEQKSPILGFPFVSLRASLAHAKWNIHHSFVGGPSAA